MNVHWNLIEGEDCCMLMHGGATRLLIYPLRGNDHIDARGLRRLQELLNELNVRPYELSEARSLQE